MRGAGPASGGSSTGGGGGMSSSFGFVGGSADCATLALGRGGSGSGWLENERRATRPPTPRRRTTATIAYFVLPPEFGTPAGGRLVGGLISVGVLSRKEGPPLRPCEGG